MSLIVMLKNFTILTSYSSKDVMMANNLFSDVWSSGGYKPEYLLA